MIRVKNMGDPNVFAGMQLLQGAEYNIPSNELPRWASDDLVIEKAGAGTLQVYGHDGSMAAGGAAAVAVLRDEGIKKVLPTVSDAGDNSLRTQGFTGVAAAGAVTNIDWAFPKTLRLRGGIFEGRGSAPGDMVKMLIIDKDDVLGYGTNPANGNPISPSNPLILTEYVPGFPVFSGPTRIEDVDLSDPIPQGLYMRLEYTSVGATPVTACLGLLAYE